MQRISRLLPCHVEQEKLRQLGKQQPRREPRDDGEKRREQRLPEQDAADVALVHSEDVVKPEFPVAPPDEKAVGVEQEQQRENRDDDGAEHQRRRHGPAAAHGLHQRGASERDEDVEHHHHARARQQIRDVKPFVFPHTVEGEAEIKALLHRASPPVASTVSVSEIF